MSPSLLCRELSTDGASIRLFQSVIQSLPVGTRLFFPYAWAMVFVLVEGGSNSVTDSPRLSDGQSQTQNDLAFRVYGGPGGWLVVERSLISDTVNHGKKFVVDKSIFPGASWSPFRCRLRLGLHP